MGTWGTGTFENDDAMDWVGDFCDSKDDKLIVESLKAVGRELKEEDFLEAPTSISALVAAEAIAALHGKPSNDLPEELADTLRTCKLKPDVRLRQLACEVIKVVTTDERSELKGLWEEEADPAGHRAWLAAVAELEARLQN